MLLFSFATLGIVFVLLLASVFGGFWAFLALGYVTVVTFSIDKLVSSGIKNADQNQEEITEFPASLRLSAVLGLSHFVILVLVVWAIAGPSALGIVEKLALFIGAGLFLGQVSHPNAHELIHHKRHKFNRLGRVIYSSLLVGHHTSAHRLIHHAHVGTDKDPASAPLGTGFYRFAQKAWRGSFSSGLKAETKRLKYSDKPWWQHPYVEYILIALASLILAFIIAGIGGALTFIGLVVYAQIQMLLSDYVQHYGLRRGILADGRHEPVGPQHSWNSPHVFSSALMLNAPRHSDHHIHPSRPYPELQLDPQIMPVLPHSLPVMAVIALWPDKWRFIMDPLCAEWQPGWQVQSSIDLGNIAPEILASLKPAGAPLIDLPQSAYENPGSPENPDNADPDVAAVRALIRSANTNDGSGI